MTHGVFGHTKELNFCGQRFEGWFSSLGEERVKVSFDEVQVTCQELSGNDVGAAILDGVELRSMQNRLTWRSNAKTVKIDCPRTHSTPIGFSDLKGNTSTW